MSRNLKAGLTIDLYLVGSSDEAHAQAAALQDLLELNGCDRDGVTVIDLLEHPEQAVKRDILAIPTLIRTSPKPVLRVVGEMADPARLWTLLTS